MASLTFWERIAFWWAVILVSAACLALLSMILSATSGLEFKDVAGLALGLIAAVVAIATIGVSQSNLGVQAREKARQDMERAELTAAGVAPLVEGLPWELGQMAAALAFRQIAHGVGIDTSNDLLGIHLRLRHRLHVLMGHQGFAIGDEVLSRMIPLPQKAASRLHAVCAMAKTLLDATQHMGGPIWGDASQPLAREHWLDQWSNKVYWMKAQLETAVQEISKAAAVGAPPPTDKEMLGTFDLDEL